MQMTSKGQITIPLHVRNQLGLLPHTEVEFKVAGDHARICELEGLGGAGGRGNRAIEALRRHGRCPDEH